MAHLSGIRPMVLDRSPLIILQLVGSAPLDMSFTEEVLVIYGYDVKTLNEFGLKEMKEISVAATPALLREFADFLLLAAKQMELASSENWHVHSPAKLSQAMGCEIVVLRTSE